MKSYSASALKTFTACQKKYWHQYIAETPQDPDYETPHAFDFGSAAHELLDKTKHKPELFSLNLVREICEKYSLNFACEGAKIASMLRAYYSHKQCNVIATELVISEAPRKAIVDAITIINSKWFIVDIKTAASFCPYLPSRLPTDIQMLQYNSMAHTIPVLLPELESKQYGGILYRELKKPLQRYKDGEDYDSFTLRCTSDYRELHVAPSADDERLLHLINLINTAERFIENHSECVKFNSKCKFFNSCHNSQPLLF
jgi:hypothetical protein